MKTHNFNHFNVVQETVKLPNGKTVDWDYITTPESVMVLPVMEDGSIILMNQFRVATKKWFYELPAGDMDGDESPENAARRELEEEAGFRARNMRLLFRSYPLGGGKSTKITNFFLATGLAEAKMKHEDAEIIKIEKFSKEKILEMLKQGDINDGYTLQLLLYYCLFVA